MNKLFLPLFSLLTLTVAFAVNSFAADPSTENKALTAQELDPYIQIKPTDSQGIKWFLPTDEPLRLAGFAWFEKDHVYERLPVAKPDFVTQYPQGVATQIPAAKCGAFHLSRHTAGGQIQFRTDSSRILISGEVLSTYGPDNVSLTGSSGFDLYCRDSANEPWVLSGVSRYDHSQTKFHVALGSPLVPKMRDCLIYFPTYNGVKSLAIGLDQDAALEAPAPWADPRKIIYYGTSITQGASASRSGMAAANILSRHLNMEVLNYGFSGNGKGEPEIAHMFASIEQPALFILDYDWNIGTGKEMAASLSPFIDILRQAHPQIPILVVSHTPGSFDGLNQQEQTRQHFADKRVAALQEVEKRKAAGDRTIEFLDGNTLFEDDWWECLADGTHPSDLGFYRLEAQLYPVVKRMLLFQSSDSTVSSSEWPFLIVRQMPSMNYYPQVMNEVFDAIQNNPGSCDELWFCIDGLTDLEASQRELQLLLPYRQRCQELGVRFSFQLGLTLGHGSQLHKTRPEDRQFSEDAFRMMPGGNRSGDFCPTSPEVRSYLFERTKLIMETLKPDSFWPDDDLRLNQGCFCPRCLEGFHSFCSQKFTREELYHHLMGSVGTAEPIREKWISYKAKLLAEVAGIFRDAADQGHPECRLGVQAVFSNWRHSGPDYFPLMRAMSGSDGRKVGIRPGAGFYSDTDWGSLLNKYLCIQEEGARCQKEDFVGQVCYEAENYPHLSLLKNPQFMMTEATLMLAAGADSLALYWHSGDYYESARSYNRFAKLCSEYRPFWEKSKARFQGTLLSGIARPLGTNAACAPRTSPGDNFWAIPHWESLTSLAGLGIPICPQGGSPSLILLTDNTILGMSRSELEKYLSGPVILDPAALQELLLTIKLPDLTLTPYTEGAHEEMASGVRYYPPPSVKYLLKTQRTDIKALSRFVTADPANHQPLGIASAIIPTPYGGNILLVHELSDLPSEPKRNLILDGMDQIVPAQMAVRLDSHEKVLLTSRVNSEGQVSSVTLFNLAPGQTDTLTLRVRRPASETPLWELPPERVVYPRKDTSSPDELRITLPPLEPYQIGTLFF